MTTVPDDADPLISEHVVAIRNRFGLDGLRKAAELIAVEIAIYPTEFGDDGSERAERSG